MRVHKHVLLRTLPEGACQLQLYLLHGHNPVLLLIVCLVHCSKLSKHQQAPTRGASPHMYTCIHSTHTHTVPILALVQIPIVDIVGLPLLSLGTVLIAKEAFVHSRIGHRGLCSLWNVMPIINSGCSINILPSPQYFQSQTTPPLSPLSLSTHTKYTTEQGVTALPALRPETQSFCIVCASLNGHPSLNSGLARTLIQSR